MRDTREEPSYVAAAAKLEPDVERRDDLTKAILWQISVAAEQCPEVPGTPLRVARAQAVPGEEILRVFFTIESDALCSLRFIDQVDDDEALGS